MIKTIVFDIGKVLIDWDPKNLYNDVFEDRNEMEWFLENVCTFDWNLSLDKGKPFAEGIAEKQAEFPKYAKEIAMFDTHWHKTVPGEHIEPVEVLQDLKKNNYPVYALTNFSSEKFTESKERFSFLKIFDGTVISAEEKMLKPDPKFFLLMCERYNIEPATTVFIDDNEKNIEAAKNLGFKTILFKYPNLLRPQLQNFGVDI